VLRVPCGGGVPPRGPSILIDKPALLERFEDGLEVARGAWPVDAFEPILIEERRKARLAELDLPQHAEERGHGFLGFALDAEDSRGALGTVAVAGLGSGAETEIDGMPPFGRGELKMRHLMQQHIGLGLAAERVPGPGKVDGRAAGQERHAEGAGEIAGDRVVALGLCALSPRRFGWIGDSPEDAARARVDQRGKALDHARQILRRDIGQDHKGD
jgi:hypothetical protein